MPKLDGKTALITGASKGIGAGIAEELAAAGAAVVVNFASDRRGAEVVLHTIRAAGGRAVAIQADISVADDVARLLQEAVAAFGRLDIVVNNAGVFREVPLAELTEGEFRREIDINLLGPLLVIRESSRYLENGGSIINIGSGVSRSYSPGYAIYSAAKAGLDAATVVLAKELAPRRIRVNAVNPGATLSEGTKAAGLYGVDSDLEKQLVAMTPLGRMGTPADIARVVAFLASEESAWLTGEVLFATGGLR